MLLCSKAGSLDASGVSQNHYTPLHVALQRSVSRWATLEVGHPSPARSLLFAARCAWLGSLFVLPVCPLSLTVSLVVCCFFRRPTTELQVPELGFCALRQGGSLHGFAELASLRIGDCGGLEWWVESRLSWFLFWIRDVVLTVRSKCRCYFLARCIISIVLTPGRRAVRKQLLATALPSLRTLRAGNFPVKVQPYRPF
jgi:hypothetical protein